MVSKIGNWFGILVHNLIIHPLLVLNFVPLLGKYLDRLHDWHGNIVFQSPRFSPHTEMYLEAEGLIRKFERYGYSALIVFSDPDIEDSDTPVNSSTLSSGSMRSRYITYLASKAREFNRLDTAKMKLPVRG